MKKILILLLLLSPLSLFAVVKNIYVNKNATGANNGTSWADAYTTLAGGTGSFQAGATNIMFVAAGTYTEELLLNLPGTHSGSLGRTNIVKGFTNGVLIDGAGTRANCIRLQDVKFVRIENMSIRGATGNGMYFFVADTNTAYRIASFKNGASGFGMQAGRTTTLRNCTSWSNVGSGVFTASDSVRIDIMNSIFQQNGNIGIDIGALPNTRLNNNIFGNAVNGLSGNEFSSNSLFISTDPASSDFLRLSAASPCRNKGTDGNDIGAFPYVVVGPTAPSTPTGLLSTPVSTNAIRVSWNDLSNETSYTLFRNTVNATSSAVKVTGLNQNVLLYTNKALDTYTAYYFWVKAYNATGVSPFSAVTFATTLQSPPAVPTWISANAPSSSQINLLWNDVSGETSFLLYRNTSNTTNSSTLLQTLGANVTTYTDKTVAPSQTYYYWLKANNGGGNRGFSASVNATTPAAPAPSAPSFILALATSASTADITWQNVANETSYTLYRATVNQTNSVSFRTGRTVNVTNFSDSGLVANTAYYYWVKAFNATGPSAFSPLSTTTTSNLSAPNAPTGLSATAISSSQIDLSWTDLPNETSYTLFRNTTASTTGLTKVIGRAAGQVTYSDTGLSASTTYHYYVKAYNAQGASAFSAGANATTTSGSFTGYGNIIYVSKLGGNSTPPYSSPATAATNIQDALASTVPGTNTILIIDDYARYSGFEVNNKNDIIIMAAPGNRPTVKSTNWIWIYNNSRNIAIVGLRRINTNPLSFGVFVDSSQDILIAGNEFVSNQCQAVFMGNQASRVIVYSNQFFNNALASVQMSVNARLNRVEKNIIRNNTTGGIMVTDTANSNTIRSNRIYANQTGIMFANDAAQNIVIGNRIYKNTTSGVQMTGAGVQSAQYNMILNNNIYSNLHGVMFDQSAKYNLVQGNRVHSHSGGFGIIMLLSAQYNMILSNQLVHNQKGMQVQDVKYNRIEGNVMASNFFSGMMLQNCTNNLLKGNMIYSNREQGLMAQWSVMNRFDANKVHHNGLQGIMLLQANQNVFTNNQVYRHPILPGFAVTGMAGTGSDSNLFRNNITWSNYWGYFIEQSSANNTIDHDTIIRNFRGIELQSGTGNFIGNSILAFNYGDFGIAGALLNNYNDVFGNQVQDYQVGTTPGANSISADPLFINTNPSSPFFLYLSSSSPCAGIASDGLAMGARPSATSLVPIRVTGFLASAIATNKISLSWNDLSTETSYTLYRNTSNDSNSATKLVGLSADITLYTNAGLLKETAYYYWIRGFNDFGGSPYSLVSFVTTYSVPPAIPTGVSVVRTNVKNALVTWADVPTETSFRIYRNTVNNSGSATLVGTVAADTLQYLDSNLAYSTVYYYWVQAFRGSTPSGFSVVSSMTTGSAPPVTGPTTDGLTVWNNAPKQGELVSVFVKSSDPISNADGEVTINLYTVSGILVKELYKDKYNLLDAPLQVDTSGLSPGTYILYVKGAGVRDYKRIYVKK